MWQNLEKAVRSVRVLIGSWRQRIRERAELSRMTVRDLRDARVSTYDARIESRKPFWRD